MVAKIEKSFSKTEVYSENMYRSLRMTLLDMNNVIE